MKVINVKGKQYVVHYSINSLVELEAATGKPFTALFDNEEGVSLTSLRRIIFYGLKSKQYDITEAAVGNILDELIEDGSSIMEVSAMFIGELSAALGMKKAEPGQAPNE